MRLLTIALLFLCFSAKSQLTTDSYNYITKGYITTIAQGLDFKKGYNFKELIKGSSFKGSLSGYTYQFSYRSFYKESDPKHTLAFMIVLSKGGAEQMSFCMPASIGDSDNWRNFFNDVQTRLYEDQRAVMFREIAMLFANAYTELENKK